VTAPTPNAELAYRVLDQIDAHPESWDQSTWWIARDCGTTACFAGWAVHLSGGQITKKTVTGWDLISTVVADGLPGLNGEHVSYAAACLLGLGLEEEFKEEAEGLELFNGHNTRDDLGRLVAEIFGPRPEHSEAVDDEIPTCRRCDMPNRVDARTGICRMCESEILVAEVVYHGPVKPPFGTPEREAYDREHGSAS
jgi:hypothetical protein